MYAQTGFGVAQSDSEYAGLAGLQGGIERSIDVMDDGGEEETDQPQRKNYSGKAEYFDEAQGDEDYNVWMPFSVLPAQFIVLMLG